MGKAIHRQIEILLVQDKPRDVKILRECLQTVSFPCCMAVVSDMESALAFLQRHTPYTGAPRPDLVLLDSYLPKQSGWEALAWMRARPLFTDIPIVMLTRLFSQFDEERIEQLQPTRCLLKPRGSEDLLRVGKAIEKVISYG
jgi:CheY-like chemotaxis protein